MQREQLYVGQRHFDVARDYQSFVKNTVEDINLTRGTGHYKGSPLAGHFRTPQSGSGYTQKAQVAATIEYAAGQTSYC